MLSVRDIASFFDLEAEAAFNNHRQVMALSPDERIRRRKAIGNVKLLTDDSESSRSANVSLLVSAAVNISDFKEGDALELHRPDVRHGIKCTLSAYGYNNEIELEAFRGNLPYNLKEYYGSELMLDRQFVDLREHVYSHFLADLNGEVNLARHLINAPHEPVFVDEQGCAESLDETLQSLSLSLLPAQRQAVIKSLAAKDYYLIQGPPGTGKSFVLGLIIHEEVVKRRHKVIVTGPNHLAVNNALIKALELYPQGRYIKVGQKYNEVTTKVRSQDKEYGVENLSYADVKKLNGSVLPWVAGLTPHALYTRRARGLHCHTLIIDEAGQMSVPLALMAMIKADKVIFAGDHKQLAPIVSSDKIEGSLRLSAFSHLLSDSNSTMLDTSFRMCVGVCRFVSNLFYDDKLLPAHEMNKECGDVSLENSADNPLSNLAVPVVLKNIDHQGKQSSDEEARFIADSIAGFLRRGVKEEDMAVLTPFRAQAANIRRLLKRHKETDEEQRRSITVDTIDKMQGQERDVIFVSLAAGDAEYMAEMADFLFSGNKLNVAFSRARFKLIVVGNLACIERLSLPDFPHLGRFLRSPFAARI